MAYTNYIKKDYFCKRCGEDEMYPNCTGSYIKGYRCNKCGEINYPIRDELNETEKLIIK